MELNKIIPDSFKSFNSPWVIKGKFLMFHRYENIPICFIEDNIIYIFLDNRIQKAVIKLTNEFVKLGYEFYFTTPLISNPAFKIDDLNNIVINHYLFSYFQKGFFKGFKKINFDLIGNMVDWCRKENCIDLIKKNYKMLDSIINKSHVNWYSQKKEYDYSEEIREDYKTLYREIQINIIGI